jgi:hypothetical protein
MSPTDAAEKAFKPRKRNEEEVGTRAREIYENELTRIRERMARQRELRLARDAKRAP